MMTTTWRRIVLLLAVVTAISLEASASDRFALVIGNQRYHSATSLRNPENDAATVSRSLTGLGFDVTTYINLDRRAFNNAVLDFRKKLTPGCVAWFYFAGHGMQVAGNNYLIPVDAQIDEVGDVEDECVQVERILGRLDNSPSNLKIMVLDCCRNNPFLRRFRGAGEGSWLGPMEAPSGTMLVFSTACGAVALDGVKNNSPFTKALCQVLNTRPAQGLELQQAIRQASQILEHDTQRQQQAWVYHHGALPPFTLVASSYTNVTAPNVVFKLPTPIPTVPPADPTDAVVARLQRDLLGKRVFVRPTKPDRHGRWFRWEDLTAKYVLIAFYNRDCGPCLGEIASIKQAYAIYPDRTLFDVVGMDLDADDMTRERMRRELGIAWENLYTDPPPADSLLAPYFDVNTEPRAMLVRIDRRGQKGTVVEVNVSGNDLLPILHKHLQPSQLLVQ